MPDDDTLAPPDPAVLFAALESIDIPEDWRPITVLPPAWAIVELDEHGGAKYRNLRAELVAILSCRRENDGQYWIHLSVSHARRCPLHDEMRVCKELFLGNREGYAVWPPKERYVNLHPHVLHIFTRMADVAVLPDFTMGTRAL